MAAGRAALLLCTAVSGCKTGSPQRGAITPATGIVSSNDLPQALQQRLWQQVTNAEVSFQSNRLAFLQENQRLLDDHNQLVTQSFAELGQQGGLKVVLAKELNETQQRVGAAAPDRQKSMYRRIDDLHKRITILDGGLCLLPTVFDGDIQTFVDSGGSVLIVGCGFGDSPGEARLVVNDFGGFLRFNVRSWQNNSILADLPMQTGYLDQPAKLVVVRNDGKRSDPMDMEFRAARDIQKVYCQYMTADFPHSTDRDQLGCDVICTGPDPGHWGVSTSLVGLHRNDCCINSVSGTDHWYLTLKNGWVLWNLEMTTMEGYSSCSGRIIAADKGVVHWPTGFSQGAPIMDLAFNWWVDANCSGAWYVGNLYVTGPVGVPYADVPSGIDPSSDRWPGKPCTLP